MSGAPWLSRAHWSSKVRVYGEMGDGDLGDSIPITRITRE